MIRMKVMGTLGRDGMNRLGTRKLQLRVMYVSEDVNARRKDLGKTGLEHTTEKVRR